jgi:DnaJ-domain-containing protein 1
LARANVNSLIDKLRAADTDRKDRAEAEQELREEEAEAARARSAKGDEIRGRGGAKDPRLARYYSQLELPYGADFAKVKRAYRRLMSKYHPDRHSHDTEKQRIATEVTQALSHAYHQLEAALERERDTGLDE